MSATEGTPVAELKAGDRFMSTRRRHLVENVRVTGGTVIVRTTSAVIFFAASERVRLFG